MIMLNYFSFAQCNFPFLFGLILFTNAARSSRITGQPEYRDNQASNTLPNSTALGDIETLNSKNGDGETAFQLACQAGRVPIVKALIEHEESMGFAKQLVEVRHPLTKWTAMFYAASCQLKHLRDPVEEENGDTTNADLLVDMLVKAGANLEDVDAEGCTAFLVAVKYSSLAMARALLLKGANVRAYDLQGRNVVHLAVEANNLEGLKMLLELKTLSDSNLFHSKESKEGKTPLQLAIDLNRIDAAKKMIASQNHFSVEQLGEEKVTGNLNESYLHAAIKRHHPGLVRAILSRGKSLIVVRNVREESALHVAVILERLEAAKVIIETVATDTVKNAVAVRDLHGRSVIHLVAMQRSSPVSKEIGMLFVTYFPDFESAIDNFGETPLGTAVKQNCPVIVLFFLTNGMNCTVQNRQGYTPLHLAKRLGFDSLVDAMVKSGKCSPDQKDACGKSVSEISGHSAYEGRCGALPSNAWEVKGYCEAIRCKEVPAILNGQLQSTPSWSSVGSTLSFKCNSGYVLRGLNTIQCDRSGTWQINGYCDPYCNEYVPMVGEVYSTGALHRIGSRRDITCIPGFHKIGSEPATCASGGRWQVATYCRGNMEALHEQLRQSSKIGDVVKVTQLLQLGILDANWNQDAENEPRCVTSDGVSYPIINGTALHYVTSCTANNVYEIVRLLIDNGADVNLKDGLFGTTALIMAAGHGQLETARLLLDRDAEINAKNIIGGTALMQAAIVGHLEIVRLLLDRNADINAKNRDGKTALMLASERGHLEIVRLLIDRKADVNAKANNEWTALMLATENGHLEIVRLLIDRKADVNVKAYNEWTALMLAAVDGHLETVRLLLDRNADINAKDLDGKTALMFAAGNGYLESAQLLLDRRADINAKASNGWTALMYAAYNGYLEPVRLLLDRKADIEPKNQEGLTALTLAAVRRQGDVLRLLKDFGASMEGCTAAICYQ